MKRSFEKELDNSRLTIVRYGFLIMLIITILLGLSLVFLKIDEKPILEIVYKYLINSYE